jgi:hypothetical protein
MSIQCLLLKTTPMYWQAYGAVVTARATGQLKTRKEAEELLALGTLGSLVGVPKVIIDVYGGCVIDQVFGDDSDTRGPVVCWTDRDYQGDAQSFDVGYYNNLEQSLGKVGNDQLSSIVVPHGYRVTLCRNDGVEDGQCITLAAGAYTNLFSYPGYEEQVSFIKVEKA